MGAWRKNNLRELRHTLGRWLAILAIIALGVGFFGGLKAAKPAMLKTGQIYLDKTAFYDFRLLTTLGLTQQDEDYFRALSGVADAEGGVSTDAIAQVNGAERTLKLTSLPERISVPEVTSGRLPQSADECLLDAHRFTEDVLGTSLEVTKTSLDGCLSVEKFTVVGLCTSPLYLNVERGTTALGGGSIDAFAYVPKDAFSLDYFTEIDLRAENADRTIYSEAYSDDIDALRPALTAALNERAQMRYENVIDDARDALADAQKQYDEGAAEYESQRADAERELEAAKRKLDSARWQIESNRQKLEDAEKTLTESREKLEAGEKEYADGAAQLASAKSEAYAELDAKQAELDENRSKVEDGLKQFNDTGLPTQYEALLITRRQIEEKLDGLTVGTPEYLTWKALLDATQLLIDQFESNEQFQQYLQLKDAKAQLDEGQTQLDAARAEADAAFAEKQAELDAARAELDEGKKQLEDGEKELTDGKAQLSAAEAQLAQGQADYDAAYETAQQGFADAEAELADGKKQLEDAQIEVEKIENPSTYVLDRTTNTGYLSFKSDSSIVEGVAKVFPLFFFLVAALVCITTMTRMVDEQRTQIGTLKALGYSDGKIAWKYISYAGSAALAGAVFGFAVGGVIFPQGIWQGYSMLYNFAPWLEYDFSPLMAGISLVAALACSVGATFFACRAELRLMPAGLMRPKAPKPGKRILLERVPFLWNRFSFLHKVSIRNIVRYKKRLYMMLLGIGGCTALIVAGFGVRDSISTVAEDQFGRITHYDISASFSTPMNETQQAAFRESFDELTHCVFVDTSSYEIKTDKGVYTVNIVATDDPDLTSVIGLRDGEKSLTLPAEGALIDRSLSDYLGVKAGDTITVTVDETKQVVLPVAGVIENYVYHYAYMTAETYERLFGTNCEFKTAYMTTDADPYALGAAVAEHSRVANVTVVASMRSLVKNMMKSMDYIVLLVIGSACALALVVLFNLCNISITERVREIATVKVLGFYRSETRLYVFREVFLLTFLGAAVGLPCGWALHRFIMQQIRIDMVSFNVRVAPLSYCLSFLITMLLSVVMCLLLCRKIDRVHMAESLKSVE